MQGRWHLQNPSQIQAVLLKSDVPAKLMAEAYFAAQDPEQAMGGRVPFMWPSKTLGLTPHIREHRIRAVHLSSEKHPSVRPDDGLQDHFKCGTSTLNTSPSNSDRKVPLSFLSPELSQAPTFPSAALKGTSSSPSLRRKVVGGKTAVKRLSIPLHRKRFKAWLGLPWQHICLRINPKKPCSSRLQSFVSGEGTGRNCGAPRNSETMESYGVQLSGKFIVNGVPSLCCCWVLVIVTAVRWQSISLMKCLSPEQDKGD